MSKRATVAEVCDQLGNTVDLFICSASFEARSLSFPLTLLPAKVKRVVVFVDSEVGGAAADVHAARIREHFGSAATLANYRLHDPINVVDTMLDALTETNAGISRCVVDVTTFTHESLLILVRVLQATLNSAVVVTGIYNGAKEYAVGLSGSEKWLTRGVSEVRSVLSYSGESLPSRPQHLIVLAGFEVERAEYVIEACEPSFLSIGLGGLLASVSQEHHQINKAAYTQILEKHQTASQFEFACDDVQGTIRALEAEMGKGSNHNVVISPLNTKISTVAVALMALANDEIQLCYAVPQEYNVRGYAEPSPDGFIFDIPIPGRRLVEA